MAQPGKGQDLTALMARRLRCPTCMRRFRPQDISTLESTPRSSVFRLRCPTCNSRRLIIAVWVRNTVRTYFTELDEQEWNHYRAALPLQADDVLRVHQMLLAYEGDLSDVLEDPLFGDAE